MGRGVLALALAFGGGCYRPTGEPACSVSCDHLATSPACPDGLTCGTDDRCYESTQCSELTVDAPMGDARPCYGIGFLRVCPLPPAVGDREILTGAFTTDAAGDCSEIVPTAAGDLCMLTSTNVLVSGMARYEGTRPIVIFASDTITIPSDASIDVSAAGAGWKFGGCPTATAGANTQNPGGSVGGGAGASLGIAGGSGGARDTLSSGASAQPGITPTVIHGGCDGGRGGQQLGAGGPGIGGGGGGMIYLLAGHRIVMNGGVYAFGGPGGAGAGDSSMGSAGGGGGGGSGGQIILDAPIVVLGSGSTLLADGGGGGSGGSNGLFGNNGSRTNPLAPAPAAGGALPATCTTCGAGGDGSYGGGAGRAGDGATSVGGGGGGGGGGGAGHIRTYSTDQVDPTGATISPPLR